MKYFDVKNKEKCHFFSTFRRSHNKKARLYYTDNIKYIFL